MKLKRDGNMIVDENGTVVCLMCECDSFGGLHTAFNADENARIIISAVAFQAANDRQYNIGDQTAERVFKAAGLVNMSDLQAVMDAVERALTPKPLEWKRGVYVSSAKSIGDNSFTVQMINRGDQGHVLYHFFNGEQNKTYHPSRDEAEAAAQLIHNAELAKYLSD